MCWFKINDFNTRFRTEFNPRHQRVVIFILVTFNWYTIHFMFVELLTFQRREKMEFERNTVQVCRKLNPDPNGKELNLGYRVTDVSIRLTSVWKAPEK